eukprot:545990_1
MSEYPIQTPAKSNRGRKKGVKNGSGKSKNKCRQRKTKSTPAHLAQMSETYYKGQHHKIKEEFDEYKRQYGPQNTSNDDTSNENSSESIDELIAESIEAENTEFNIYMLLIFYVTVAMVPIKHVYGAIVQAISIIGQIIGSFLLGYIWVPSTSTICRRIRGPLIFTSLLLLALVLITTDPHSITLITDDTTKIGTYWNAVNVEYYIGNGIAGKIPIDSGDYIFQCWGYVDMYSKDANGVSYSIKEVIERLQWFINYWEKYDGQLRAVYPFVSYPDLRTEIKYYKTDRANVNKAVMRLLRGWLLHMKNWMHCVRHDISNFFPPIFAVHRARRQQYNIELWNKSIIYLFEYDEFVQNIFIEN